MLVTKVFPRLRQIAYERNVTLTEVDLRWGITEEEAKSSKVVEICLFLRSAAINEAMRLLQRSSP